MFRSLDEFAYENYFKGLPQTTLLFNRSVFLIESQINAKQKLCPPFQFDETIGTHISFFCNVQLMFLEGFKEKGAGNLYI